MAITVTATQGGSTANGFALRVFVLTQAAAVQNGATANAAINSSTAFTASITTTQTGSRVYGAAANGSNSSFSAAASTTLVDDVADATNTERYGTFKATSLTGTPGATTLGLTAAAASTGPLAMAEIKTAGTLTEDGSAPALASTTGAGPLSTASFTPPAGSLLVALIGSDGGAGVTTFTVSGGGLTWTEQVKNNPSAGDYAGVWIAQVPAAAPAAPAAWLPPAYEPGIMPGLPFSEPFTPWPQYVTGGVAAQDVLAAAATVTAAAAATLDVVKAGWPLQPQYAPAWFPSAPGAPGAEPFTPWPLGQTGVNSAALTAATTVTAAGAAALTESKPLNAATTVTAAGAAAETTSKPLSAAQTVTAAAAASLTVVKAGVTPAPLQPPAWFPSAPSAPGAEPFAPWPAWTGAGVSAIPVDVLNAAAVITAAGAAALTESKPVTAASTVTAAVTAAVTTSKPLTAAVTVTAAVTAAPDAVKAGVTPAPLYVPAWFPIGPSAPAGEPFAPWPAWTGTLPATGPAFTIGVLTAADKAQSALTAATAGSVLTAPSTPLATLTATDQRTGGPS